VCAEQPARDLSGSEERDERERRLCEAVLLDDHLASEALASVDARGRQERNMRGAEHVWYHPPGPVRMLSRSGVLKSGTCHKRVTADPPIRTSAEASLTQPARSPVPSAHSSIRHCEVVTVTMDGVARLASVTESPG